MTLDFLLHQSFGRKKKKKSIKHIININRFALDSTLVNIKHLLIQKCYVMLQNFMLHHVSYIYYIMLHYIVL